MLVHVCCGIYHVSKATTQHNMSICQNMAKASQRAPSNGQPEQELWPSWQ